MKWFKIWLKMYNSGSYVASSLPPQVFTPLMFLLLSCLLTKLFSCCRLKFSFFLEFVYEHSCSPTLCSIFTSFVKLLNFLATKVSVTFAHCCDDALFTLISFSEILPNLVWQLYSTIQVELKEEISFSITVSTYAQYSLRAVLVITVSEYWYNLRSLYYTLTTYSTFIIWFPNLRHKIDKYCIFRQLILNFTPKYFCVPCS